MDRAGPERESAYGSGGFRHSDTQCDQCASERNPRLLDERFRDGIDSTSRSAGHRHTLTRSAQWVLVGYPPFLSSQRTGTATHMFAVAGGYSRGDELFDLHARARYASKFGRSGIARSVAYAAAVCFGLSVCFVGSQLSSYWLRRSVTLAA